MMEVNIDIRLRSQELAILDTECFIVVYRCFVTCCGRIVAVLNGAPHSVVVVVMHKGC
jgi:hypothetical protein